MSGHILPGPICLSRLKSHSEFRIRWASGLNTQTRSSGAEGSPVRRRRARAGRTRVHHVLITTLNLSQVPPPRKRGPDPPSHRLLWRPSQPLPPGRCRDCVPVGPGGGGNVRRVEYVHVVHGGVRGGRRRWVQDLRRAQRGSQRPNAAVWSCHRRQVSPQSRRCGSTLDRPAQQAHTSQAPLSGEELHLFGPRFPHL